MLRITLARNQNGTSLRLEGRLTGPWVEELERAWRDAHRHPTADRLAVDLTDVTLVSDEGKKLLGAMYGEGAKLKAESCSMKRLVDEIEQAFSRPQPPQSH